jgi:hypothetical protein
VISLSLLLSSIVGGGCGVQSWPTRDFPSGPTQSAFRDSGQEDSGELDSGDATTDTTIDTEEPYPEPRDLDPCGSGDCWLTSLTVQPCRTGTIDEDFSSGRYNVHQYRSSASSAAETRIRLTRTRGDWQPALIVTDLDGRVLSDGETGRAESGLEVQVLSDGRRSDTAELLLVTSEDLDLAVHVTGWDAVDSDFTDFQPTDSTYTLRLESVCDGVVALDCAGPTVNGQPVSEPACGWLEHFGREVVPALAGSRQTRLETAAIVAWWSLKEGVLFLDNPIVYSNCGTDSGSEYIDPLEVCGDGHAWQVGISGIQVPTFLDDQPSDEAAALYPAASEDEVLWTTATEALLTSEEIDAVVVSSGKLRTSWLLRDCAIGTSLQVDIIVRECIDDTRSWCTGTGWTATALYAADAAAVRQSIFDLEVLFDALAP